MDSTPVRQKCKHKHTRLSETGYPRPSLVTIIAADVLYLYVTGDIRGHASACIDNKDPVLYRFL